MTVSYVKHVATSRFMKFLRVLLLWKGSIYKLVWFELALFGVLYSLISVIYRFCLWGDFKTLFELFCIYCSKAGNFMPIAFILSFYVTMIANRWWDQFKTIPWPDHVALFVNTYIPSNDSEIIMIKRNIIRYMNISLLLFLRSVSPQMKKKFPTESSLLNARLFNAEEFDMFTTIDESYNRYFVPLIWATNLTKYAFYLGAIKTEGRMNNILLEIANYRDKLNKLFTYDWVNPPLVYTQTATIAVYTFFLISLFSNQFLDPIQNYPNHQIDFYVPIFSVMQLVFYFGWLKVAEALINPFGEDDDDFDCLGLIERNFTACLLFVEPKDEPHPELVKDPKWDQTDYLIDHVKPNPELAIFVNSLGNIPRSN